MRWNKVILIISWFGEFTGTHLVEPKESDKIFVVAEDEIIKI